MATSESTYFPVHNTHLEEGLAFWTLTQESLRVGSVLRVVLKVTPVSEKGRGEGGGGGEDVDQYGQRIRAGTEEGWWYRTYSLEAHVSILVE